MRRLGLFHLGLLEVGYGNGIRGKQSRRYEAGLHGMCRGRRGASLGGIACSWGLVESAGVSIFCPLTFRTSIRVVVGAGVSSGCRVLFCLISTLLALLRLDSVSPATTCVLDCLLDRSISDLKVEEHITVVRHFD